LAAFIVESLEATIGWYISLKIGASKISEESSWDMIILNIVIVILIGIIIALFGAALARLFHGPKSKINAQPLYGRGSQEKILPL
jgi:H+/Cl- antiporter ClcA